MKIKLFFTIFIIFLSFLCCNTTINVYSDELSDSINQQIENIDLSELENYFDNLNIDSNQSFTELIKSLLKGEYELNYETFFQYIKNIIFNNLYNLIPLFVSIIGIAIFCSIINNFKSNFSSEGIHKVILFIFNLSVILLLSYELRTIFINGKNTIYNLSKLSEIMSPIIISLMIAAGGNVSAKVYSPAVAFLSNGIINVITSIIIPLIAVMIVFTFISSLSSTYKFSKFIEIFTSIIKWILGILTAVFSIFLTIQGITSATFDGISIKAAKYAISNSIPIVGSFLKDGFDIMVAGSILIKNSIGLGIIISVFFTILSPLVFMICFSVLLKIAAAIINLISDGSVSDICSQSSKCISYIIASMLVVGFMFFICILLMIFSANAFI